MFNSRTDFTVPSPKLFTHPWLGFQLLLLTVHQSHLPCWWPACALCLLDMKASNPGCGAAPHLPPRTDSRWRGWGWPPSLPEGRVSQEGGSSLVPCAPKCVGLLCNACEAADSSGEGRSHFCMLRKPYQGAKSWAGFAQVAG